MNKQKEVIKAQALSKRIISTVVSVCTAFPKPRRDLDFNEWQRIEYRTQKVSDSQPLNRGYYL